MVGEDTNSAAQRQHAPTQGCHQFTIYKTLFQEYETTHKIQEQIQIQLGQVRPKKTTAIEKVEFVLVVL